MSTKLKWPPRRGKNENYVQAGVDRGRVRKKLGGIGEIILPIEEGNGRNLNKEGRGH